MIPTLRKLRALKDKRVLIRVDFNEPIKNGKLLDDTRIRKTIPTLKYLLKNKVKQIQILTHLGRPKGRDKAFSTKPLAQRLSKLLKQQVTYVNSIQSTRNTPRIVMLENVRFYPEEKTKSKVARNAFAKKLAKHSDLYINEAFSNAHRDHASMTAITHYLPSVAGFLVEQEYTLIKSTMHKPKKPIIAVLGGVKLKTKIPGIKGLLKIADKILIGGAMAHPFLKMTVDADAIKLAQNMLKTKLARKIVLPVDFDHDGQDIGPKTIKLFRKHIANAKTIIHNGPVGYFEKYPKGTQAILSAIAKKKAVLIGGGDTLEAIKKCGLERKFPTAITAGGALLAYLATKKLPAIQALEKNIYKLQT